MILHIRKSLFEIGIDVGYSSKRFPSMGVLWWGNTRDEETLKDLIEDCKKKDDIEEVVDERTKEEGL